MVTTTAGSSGTSQSRSKSRSAIKRAGSGLLNSLLRRADIKSVSVDRLDADSLTIEELSVGSTTVDTIAISDIRTTVDTGRAFLNNVRTVVRFQLRVSWEIDTPLGGRSGTVPINSPIPVPFPALDVEITDLDNINLSAPTAQVSETAINVLPVTDLSFNGGVVTDVTISDIRMPVDGYGLAGAAFDSFSLSHVGVPDAGIASVSVGSIEPDGNITLPSISTDLISIADLQVPDVQSNSPITVRNTSAETTPIDILDVRIRFLGVSFKVSIVFRSTLDMNIESLTLQDMEATSTIDSVSLENIQFPFKATGIQMAGIGASQLRAEEVSL